MKIRIKGNSIRFRLTKSDVAAFSENRFIQESTNFGSRNFVYGMKASENAQTISAEFKDNEILISIPLSLTRKWTESELVGLSEEIIFNDQQKLFVLIEKDFKCLDETSEDQSDNYANPLAEQ